MAVACEECAIARKRPWGVYMTTCSDCRARMLANGPAFFESRKAAKLTPAYRAALALVRTKGETIESAHKRVREWDRRRWDVIAPAQVIDLVPPGSGNFWVSVTMVDRR